MGAAGIGQWHARFDRAPNGDAKAITGRAMLLELAHLPKGAFTRREITLLAGKIARELYRR